MSFVDGHKLHATKKDMERMKELTNEMCRERGFTIAQKGKHFDVKPFDVGEVVVRWSSIFVTFSLKKIIDWNISFQTVSCIHLMNVDVYDCNSHIHNPTCFHLTLDLFQTDSVV